MKIVKRWTGHLHLWQSWGVAVTCSCQKVWRSNQVLLMVVWWGGLRVHCWRWRHWGRWNGWGRRALGIDARGWSDPRATAAITVWWVALVYVARHGHGYDGCHMNGGCRLVLECWVGWWVLGGRWCWGFCRERIDHEWWWDFKNWRWYSLKLNGEL